MKKKIVFPIIVFIYHIFGFEQGFSISLLSDHKVADCLDQEILCEVIETRLGTRPLTLKASAHGGDNKVFFVGRDKDVIAIAKKYTKRTMSEVDRIYACSQLLETQVPVPRTIDKFLFSGHIPLVIQQFLPGQHIEELNFKQLEEVALCMGRIHSVKPNDLILNKKEFDYGELLEQCCSFPEFEWILDLYKSIDLHYLETLPLSLIHGDISGSNLLFLDDRLSGIIDLDHMRYSYRLTDIARAQVFFSFDHEGNLEEQKMRAFINLYQRFTTLSSKELENFYPHLKQLLIKMILETYYYVEVKKEVSPEIFKQSSFNQSWQLLLKKLHAIEKKYSFSL